MTTAEEMIERAALAIAVSDGCGLTINGNRTLCDDPRADESIRATFCACRASARAACAVAVEMCAEMITPPDTEGGEYFDGLRGQAARFEALAAAIKGE